MKKLMALILGTAILASAGLACTGGGSPSTSTPGTTTNTSPSPSTTPSYSVDEQKAINAAKSSLSTRLGIPATGISVVSIQAVNWPDTSLGVPEAGKVYAQVITSGYKIILSAGGTHFEYHTGNSADTIIVVASS